MLGYKVPAPDEAMLISGGRAKSNAPFRVVTGHGAFILPVFRKARFLTLAMCEAEVAEKCVTQQGITLNVRSVIAFKVGNDTGSIISAAQRFLSDQDQMAVLLSLIHISGSRCTTTSRRSTTARCGQSRSAGSWWSEYQC